jgi:hypothetical protein
MKIGGLPDSATVAREAATIIDAESGRRWLHGRFITEGEVDYLSVTLSKAMADARPEDWGVDDRPVRHCRDHANDDGRMSSKALVSVGRHCGELLASPLSS